MKKVKKVDLSSLKKDKGGRIMCTAWKRGQVNKPDGRCKNAAIKGTDKCRFHGGTSPIKHGRYSKYVTATQKERYKTFKDDPDLRSLRDEIALLRSGMTYLLENTKALEMNPDKVIVMCESIRKNVTALVQIEDGLRLTLDIGQIRAILENIMLTLREEIHDQAVLNRIAVKLGKLGIPDAH